MDFLPEQRMKWRGEELPHALLLPANQKAMAHRVTITALQTGETEQAKLAKENMREENPSKLGSAALCSLHMWSLKVGSCCHPQ